MKIKLAAAGVIAVIALSGTAEAQTLQRRANIGGNSYPGMGKCTIEVVVDGAAEVEIRGDSALLRNLAGQTPQWRRFECTGVMPGNPPNFRFRGLEGRGGQELVRAAQNGTAAVVRIQDPQGGSDSYSFDVMWGGPERQGDGYPPRGNGGVERGGLDRGGRRERYTTEQAVGICRDAVTEQARERFHTDNIAFRGTTLDDNPGRQDWITGMFDVRRGYDRDETYRFSCSVNFEEGTVRSAQIEPMDRDRNERVIETPRVDPARLAIGSCQRAVEDNIRQRGYQHVDFLAIDSDERPGRRGWIVGNARADIRFRSDSFEFSCSVDPRDGDVRSVDVRQVDVRRR